MWSRIMDIIVKTLLAVEILGQQIRLEKPEILLWMEEILHHLGWLKPYK